MADNAEVQIHTPAFSGTESSRQVENWLMKAEACVAKITSAPDSATDAQKREVSKNRAKYFQTDFVGDVHTWIKNWKYNNRTDTEDYEANLTAFKARYLPAGKLTDVNAIIVNLKQKLDSSVENFRDKCESREFTLMDYEQTDPQQRETAGYKAAKDRIAVNLFVAGVLPTL